ncbi:MAG: DNA topoisomerase VI subunit B [Phycisphaerales bacterium]|nr:MAG: DNA topoisomerase VI subunit B [Phycisphaerales bacterium]
MVEQADRARLSDDPADQLTLPFSRPAAAGAEAAVAQETASIDSARSTSRRSAGREPRRATAESMARQQREISVSEFFTKNRHLLGFDNKRKALLTTVKEAVDNSLDACEEAGILPDVDVHIQQRDEDRFRVTVRDNGPGIVKQQIPKVFGQLLYGSKFHRLKMSRGQQGIGISAAGMYGLITTGKPIRIVSRTGPRAQAHQYKLAIDTQKNRPDIISEETVEVDWPSGTEVSIELVATYHRARQSVDEYLELVAIANPHARITYHPPNGTVIDYARGTDVLPPPTREIKPHPYGIELGTLMKMLKQTECRKLGAFLQTEFSRVSPAVAAKIVGQAGLTMQTWVNSIDPPTAEKLYKALQAARLKAPPTDCLAPIGAEGILRGMTKGIKAEFYTAVTRDPVVYRGNPFQIEVGIAYGGELGGDRHDEDVDEKDLDVQARVIRYANRVPLLYQQGACATYKAVTDTRWNNYGLSQSAGALPRAPMVVLIHLASVWVPFTSEGKEAIADYDEIRKEVRLALSECGRRLGSLLRRKKKKTDFSRRRDVFHRYINEVVDAARAIAVINKDEFRRNLVRLAESHTEAADLEFDDTGRAIKPSDDDGNGLGLPDTVVVARDEGEAPAMDELFDTGATAAAKANVKSNGRKEAPAAKKKRARKK